MLYWLAIYSLSGEIYGILSLDVPSTLYLSRYERNYRSCSLDSSQRNLAGSKGSSYSQDSQRNYNRGISLAIFEEFILVLSITLLAYLIQSRALELVWLGGFVAFALHLLLHTGQSILLRKYIPALITSILCFPISAYLITNIVHLWRVSTSEFSLFSLVGPGIVVINLLFALWLGKKYSVWLAHNH